jgi:hypothetical protein
MLGIVSMLRFERARTVAPLPEKKSESHESMNLSIRSSAFPLYPRTKGVNARLANSRNGLRSFSDVSEGVSGTSDAVAVGWSLMLRYVRE